MKINTPTRRVAKAGRFILPVIAMFAVVLGAYMMLPSSEAQPSQATITIRNNSQWTLMHFYVSPVSENRWGPDQLGDEVIANGESFTLTNVPCDNYDVKLVDEDGDQCIIRNVDMCDDDSVWEINQSVLANCN